VQRLTPRARIIITRATSQMSEGREGRAGEARSARRAVSFEQDDFVTAAVLSRLAPNSTD
jgi:hypothetical protein